VDVRKAMKPAVEDLDDSALWDRVAQVLAGISKEDEASAAEDDMDSELEGFSTSIKVGVTEHALNTM
jgi:hypothetical protein